MEHIFEDSEWHADRMLRKQLNEAYNAMDEQRIRVQVQASVINELKARLEAYEKLEVISEALIIARDVIEAEARTRADQMRALEQSGAPETSLQREMSVRMTGVDH